MLGSPSGTLRYLNVSTLPQCFVDLLYDEVPLLVLVRDGLVHEFVGNPVRAVILEDVGKLIPHVNELLLSRFVRKQRILHAHVHGVEVVATDYVEVHNGPDVVLACQVQGIREKVPGLRQFVAIFIPELHLVDGNAHVVEAQLVKPGEVIFLDVLCAGFSAFPALRQPVAEVGAAFDFESPGGSCAL